MIEQFKLGVAEVAKSFSIDMWLARHTPEKVLPLLHRALAGIREEFADAVAHGGGIYAAGYCFGAKYALLLGASAAAAARAQQAEVSAEGESQEEGMRKTEPEVKAVAIAHGTQVTVQDIAQCAVPLSIVAVESDSLFPDEVRDAGVKQLQEKGAEHELQVYPGVPHGFAVLGDYEEAEIKEQQGRAFKQMLGWLNAH
jgi:dienelactone hydrolase